jgi:CheY-like chemotaxis protein
VGIVASSSLDPRLIGGKHIFFRIHERSFPKRHEDDTPTPANVEQIQRSHSLSWSIMTHPCTILAVDDEPSILRMICYTLAVEDCDVLLASSAEQAADIMSRRPIDILITDERLPGMNGSQLIGQLKRAGITIPTILISAYGRAYGADRFLPKPFDPDALVSAVDELTLARN